MNQTTYESIMMDDNLPLRVLHIDTKTNELLKDAFRNNALYFIPPHWHMSLEFTYVIEGAMMLRINQDERIIEAGETFVINSGELHEFHNVEGRECEVICLQISYEFLKKMVPNYKNLYFKIDQKDNTYNSFGDKFIELLDCYNTKHEYKYLKVISILLDMIYSLVEKHTIEKDTVMAHNQHFIIGAVDYIHHHYDQQISLDQISDDFGMSKEHFARKFKSSIGLTFLDYLMNYRIFKALPEISNSSATIDSIARKHGFPNTKSLINQFKRKYNETPMQFRNNHQISIIDHKAHSNEQQ